MANLIWSRWVCYGSDWETSYDAYGTVTISRAAGSDTAVVTANINMRTLGGDAVYWRLWLKAGDGSWTSVYFPGNGHGAGAYKNAGVSQSVAVDVGSGSLTAQVQLEIVDAAATSGKYSDIKSVTLSYDSKGASTIASINDISLGGRSTITWTPYSANFTYYIKYQIGSWTQWTDAIEPQNTSAQSYSYAIPNASAEAATILAQIPDAQSAVMTVSLYTYTSSGPNGKMIGTDSKTCTVSVPASYAAPIKSLTVADTTSKISGVYLKNISEPKVTVVASEKYSAMPKTATITAFTASGTTLSKATCNLSKQSDGTYKGETTLPAIAIAGTTYIHTRLTDSRGLTDSLQKSIYISDYEYPTIKSLNVSVNRNTNLVTLTAAGIVHTAKDSSGTEKNSATYTLKRTKLSDSSQTTLVSGQAVTVSDSGYAITYSETLSDIETETYEYALTVTDKISTTTQKQKTGIVCISRLAGGKGLAIFREANESDEGYVSMWGKGFYVHNTDAIVGGGISLEMSNKGNKGLYAWGGGDWDEQWLAYYSQTSGMFQIPNWKNIGYEANTEPMYPVTFSEIGAPQVVRPIQKSTYAFGSDTTGYVWFCVYGHVVNFYGTIKGMTASAASHTCAFTLPEELRPWMGYQIFPAYNISAPYAANWYSSCWISKTGKILIYKNSAQSITDVYVSGTFISLDPSAATNSSLLMDSPEGDTELS